MPFNIFNWLFQDAITAGGPNPDGSEVFHYFWPYLIFCGVGLLIWFYFWVEGRKRFVDSTYYLKHMLERYLNWLAIICFIGGPLRMLYAAVFEEGAPRPLRPYGPPTPMPVHPQQFGPPQQRPALTPPPARAQGGWRRPNTAELANPPSVTENTTRLLDKEDRTPER